MLRPLESPLFKTFAGVSKVSQKVNNLKKIWDLEVAVEAVACIIKVAKSNWWWTLSIGRALDQQPLIVAGDLQPWTHFQESMMRVIYFTKRRAKASAKAYQEWKLLMDRAVRVKSSKHQINKTQKSSLRICISQKFKAMNKWRAWVDRNNPL